MNVKTLLFSGLWLCMVTAAYAQDKIYKRNGDIVEAKVKSVDIRTITYSLWTNQDGPEYTTPKREVEKIVYKNGTEDVLNKPAGGRDHVDSKRPFRPNILAIAPVQFTENGIAGVSISYEHAIDKDDIISFYVPVVVTFNPDNSVNSGGSGSNDAMYYIMPGLKFYPTMGYGTVKYAIGPSAVIGTGTKSSSYTTYDPVNGGYTYYSTDQTHFVFGLIVNNSLNINPTPHLYIGGEFGLGFTYIDRIGGVGQGVNVLAQGSFKIGYRF